jgi:hypothetical protein
MLAGRRSGKALAGAVGGIVSAVVAVGTAPVAWGDDAAVAAWLTTAFPKITAIHVAENQVMAALAPAYPPATEDEPDPPELPLTDFNALEAPCDSLGSARIALQDLLPTPDQALTVEVQQAVDDIETAAEQCTTVIDERITDRSKARQAIQFSLRDAAAHLAEADVILTKLATPT